MAAAGWVRIQVGGGGGVYSSSFGGGGKEGSKVAAGAVKLSLSSSFLRVYPSGCSSLNSNFQGQVCLDPSLFTKLSSKDAGQKGRVTTCMAWGGALASVRLIIQGKHMELTDAVKNYVEEKVGNAVHNHGNLVKEVDVRMSVRGGETGRGQKLQRCEVTLFTKKHGVVRAEEETDNMYASIDRVSDVISRKLRKIKEKDGGHGRTPRMRNQPRIGELLSDEVVDLAPILEKKVDELPDEVVRTKYFEMRPMTSFQALEEMVNVGHDFYAFRNAESGEVNILYKRHHGGYGMIIPRSDESWELGQNGATKDKSSQ
ncbi:hypothetical protein BDL97_08G010100 [Sphagnum fallax]|nr:hypothetical protein BDL97_08G010100 [Sphagnum fallax]KAH8953174.1 hypothetical protein BDL97_08G010100 [Sphagnum fallax]